MIVALVGLTVGCQPLPPAASAPASGARTPASARGAAAAGSGAGTRTDKAKDKPAKGRGWGSLDAQAEARVRDFARDYAAYLARAKTERAAVRGLIELYADSGASEIPLRGGAKVANSGRYYLRSANNDAVAFVRVGRQPLERGARIIIASVDAPHIVLEQRSIYDKADLTLLDTELYGHLDLPSWLSRPLALHLFLARPGAADGDLELVIGERPDDPVLVIPDLLPHLSGKVQRDQIVDSPERMDAIAARTRQALLEMLAGHGIDERALAQAEISLVPAGGPVFVGVDRALLSGHGHGHRALAYAAVRALASEAEAPERSSMVVVLRSLSTERGSSSALGFAEVAFVRALEALETPGEGERAGMDVLDTRRAYARSAAWLSGGADGELHQGLVLAPLSDDATPGATRQVIDDLERAGAAYQFGQKAGWSYARRLAPLDIDVVEVSLPVRGRGAPAELLSTLDLYHAFQAAVAWLGGAS